MTVDELRAVMGPSGTWDNDLCYWPEEGWLMEVTPEQQEIRDYLSLIANNKLKSDKLGSDEALAYLQEQFDMVLSVYRNYYEGNFQGFPCEGLDFRGKELADVDLSKCTGITGEQIMSASSIQGVVLPAIAFTGDESFEDRYLYAADFSKCTGITPEQILSAGDLTSAKLPAITFTGNESFAGKDLCATDLSRCTGITGEQIISAGNFSYTKLPAITFTGNESFDGKDLMCTDLSKCTGITSAQIRSATNISNMCMTTAQYNEWKSTLQSRFNGKYVYVDGVRTKIQ